MPRSCPLTPESQQYTQLCGQKAVNDKTQLVFTGNAQKNGRKCILHNVTKLITLPRHKCVQLGSDNDQSILPAAHLNIKENETKSAR